jgi:hypothetical protein
VRISDHKNSRKRKTLEISESKIKYFKWKKSSLTNKIANKIASEKQKTRLSSGLDLALIIGSCGQAAG